MSRRKPDIYEQQKQRYWDGYRRAPLLKEKYPKVTNISVEMSFKDNDERSNPKPQQVEFSQESKAFFKIECPCHECVSGGFDFSSAINELVTSHLDKLDGTITCQGWQDKERINKHRCFLKLNYTIFARYKNES
ncbi:MAG: hypothetical protein KAS69_02370 [Planctomycetes bacterium]|nr:hypothetical protein [Planctomycetota bacterium]